MLGVDALVSGQITLTKPLGRAAAITAFVIFDPSPITNHGHINITIHEAEESSLLWNYEHAIGRSIMSNQDLLARDLVRAGSTTFPYRK